ncbi:MAG: tRNA (N(6)-L-threonylcarbamoyladenosine(37)-C(2))-methylthiotransferase MtaB [Alphaproteobacteria bacterium]|nr:tRNA (N(6)-L-threonylcarbamoyladenosine(37)-C(2))-methylthiotransferase MtaB [Alphaproteobacteria bacterium]
MSVDCDQPSPAGTRADADGVADAAPTEIVTLGCRLNAFEAEVMRGHAAAAGLRRAVIINTCAVTRESERQSRQAIRRARRQDPGATIIVTGCAAQINAAAFTAMAEVDHVIGNAEKLAPETFRAFASGTPAPRLQVGDIMAVRETAPHLVEGFEGRARAYVEVQQGCDHRCTFCIIPYGRGNSRSAPVGEVVRQAQQLTAAGYREIVLTGVDLTGYGADLPGRPSLGEMTRRLLRLVPGLERLRLSSIDVAEVDDVLFQLITTEPRIMPHLHLSLQAGDDMILKRMKRRHSRAQAADFCASVRAARPEVAFGADLIAGFPTETEAMFDNTLALVEDAGLTWLHVFPYSARPGTPAARMPALPGPVVKDRARRLRAAGDAARASFLASCVGGTETVLVEQPGLGRTGRFAHVALSGEAATGAIVTARITGADGRRLTGIAAP